MTAIEWEDEEEFEEWEDEELCPNGYTWDECCECVLRAGVETCEFLCPFGGVPRECHRETCDRMLEKSIWREPDG